MRIIATQPEENAILKNLSEELREKGIYPNVIKYEDGFGSTVWSIDDLLSYSATHDWLREEKIRFMERYGEKIGGAKDDNWAMLSACIDQHIDERKDKNLVYVGGSEEFEKIKFYLDVCGGGWVRRLYYNPDSNAGGQLVDDLISAYVILEAAAQSEAEFWCHLDENAKQTLVDVDMPGFESFAKEFAEKPCDFAGQSAETMEALIKWAAKNLKSKEESQ